MVQWCTLKFDGTETRPTVAVTNTSVGPGVGPTHLRPGGFHEYGGQQAVPKYVFGEPGPPGALQSQGSEQDGACRAVSSGAAVR